MKDLLYESERLEAKGYKIENAKITSVDLSMADHGCLVLSLVIEGNGWGVCFGGHVIGKGYLGASEFEGYERGTEYIMRIMDTVGVEKFNSMKGKHIRVATKGWGESVKIIGNIIDDKWFNVEEFFKNEE